MQKVTAVIVGSKLKILKANHNAYPKNTCIGVCCYRWLKVKNSESKSQPSSV